MATNIETALPLSAHSYPQKQRAIRTLVVDDTPDFLNAVCAVLEERPCIEIVGTATNGLAALQAVEGLRPDLVIMDVNMPVMNGFQTAARLSTDMPWVTILMMSADDDPETEAACLACGADAFLWKGRLAEGLEARLSELELEAGEQDLSVEELAGVENLDTYAFHNKNYEYYRDLLEYAQAAGSRTVAASAARMLLFHLRQLFRCLSTPRQHAMKLALSVREA